jgi:hypothetical protein
MTSRCALCARQDGRAAILPARWDAPRPPPCLTSLPSTSLNARPLEGEQPRETFGRTRLSRYELLMVWALDRLSWVSRKIGLTSQDQLI